MTRRPQATLILVPGHRVLETSPGANWSFERIHREIEMVSAYQGPQEICVFLAPTELTMREVDHFGILRFIAQVCNNLSLHAELLLDNVIHYAGHVTRPESLLTPIGDASRSDRLLKVHVAAKEVADFHEYRWSQILYSRFDLRTALPSPANRTALPVELLEPGFSHPSGAVSISLLQGSEPSESAMWRYPATGVR